MSLASPLARRRKAEPANRQPNELDRYRIARAIEGRSRYRYVTPSVLPVDGGYLIRSACCSRSVDPQGGEIDVALLWWEADRSQWLLYRKDHAAGCWVEDSRYARLAELFLRLNADPEKRFWQ